jgi:PEGA domain-containing protein
VVIRTFELSREWREFGQLSDLLDSFRKLCETTLDHPSVARPLAFGAQGEIPYLVYSHLAGTAMDAVMRKGRARPVAEVLQRTRQLAVAIDCAAGEGIHHGMMAPCDVFLDGERTGVTGFGLGQALIKVAIPVEADSRYDSPQRLAGAPPTLADDVYSLAAITLELLIGTPADPGQDTSRALREAQGLPERRRLPRPAPHETRVFTAIAGVDAGKLRACFAAAFSEEPSERPSTACDFVTSFEDAFSNKRETDEPATIVGADEFLSEESEDPHPAPVLETKRREDVAPVDLPFRQEREPRVDVPLFANLTPAPETPARSASRALLVAVAVAFSFGAGFGGGFLVGQHARLSAESMNVNHQEAVTEPQPTHAAAADPKPMAPAVTPTPAPSEKESISEPIPATVPPPRTVPAVESGRLLVRSTPAGAGVVVDGQSRGVTPLAVGELPFGAHRIEVSHPGEATRWLQVTLSKRRPTRSIDFDFRPASVAAHDTADTSPSTRSAPSGQAGSLQVASRPSAAQVFIDDNLIGTTPLLLSNVATGLKRLRIELQGYKSWTTSIQIEPSARSRVSASLEP